MGCGVMMVVKNKYEIEEFAYLVTDPEQHKRIVTRIIISKCGIVYELCFGAAVSEHYDFEIST